MKLKTNQPIAIASIGGKTYIVPNWLEVPEGTQLSDIEIERPKIKKPEATTVEEYVTGSSGDEYLVKINDNGKSECECWGFRRYRRDCKHIRELKAKIQKG